MTEVEREAHVVRLLPAVYGIARRVARICRLRESDDLVGDGSLGLVRAVDSFDPNRGVSLDCYARHVILGTMLNGMRRRDPVSERARRLVRHAEYLYAELVLRGAAPTERDLERALPGLREARSQVLWGLPLSLDMPLPLGAELAPDWKSDPARLFDTATKRRAIRRAVAALPPRLRKVVAFHYFGELPLRALSRRMAVSPQRVSQLHCRALRRLREELKEAV